MIKTFEEFTNEVMAEHQTSVEVLMPHMPFDTSKRVINEAANRYAKHCIIEDRQQLMTEIRSYIEPCTMRDRAVNVIMDTPIILPL